MIGLGSSKKLDRSRYGRYFLDKLLSPYCVNPAGKYFGMSPPSWGLVQALQRYTDTHRRASAPGRSEGRSKYRRLARR